MQLTILGSGAAFTDTGRASTSFLLSIKKNLILLDAGYGVFLRLKQAGYSALDLTHILITHTHLDHVSDLPVMLWTRDWNKHGKFEIIGPQGFKKFCRQFIKITMPDILEKRAKRLARKY